ncbi:hypothetical protein H696_05516 [Fonticula alba]|uniref:Suppressor of forked domain-containing protein n=1 Tax=Fonticula alba TaxID=691883 RepID=A0A058Z1C9_FONAL|nr:hypothetical protein H696_05516 [Fonticula alba]KCV68050.1 hypothetical protein H696_05516 [Fonticula alba]|eukprot:XP_009497617.1 hypothetical protein H696_05516 [Fonticula alba]
MTESFALESALKRFESTFTQADLAFENDLFRAPMSLKTWFRYIEHKTETGASDEVISFLYERALKAIPYSYKIWHRYLTLLRKRATGLPIGHPAWRYLVTSYERSLAYLSKMPRLWIEYCLLLEEQQCITATRRGYDRALRALPLSQHERIWPNYIQFVTKCRVPDTAMRVFRRYLKFDPTKAEDFVEYLIAEKRYNEAAERFSKLVIDDTHRSKDGLTKQEQWLEFLELCCKNANGITSISVEAFVRHGIRRYTAEHAGRLWTTLADYFIRLGQFEKARDIFEEGMDLVSLVRDFSHIFDAYAKFEETLADALANAELDATPEGQEFEPSQELQLALARFEHLLDRRPILVNDVHIRQDPNNVQQWLERCRLHEADPEKVVSVFEDAISSVDIYTSGNGHYVDLWKAYARYFEQGRRFPGPDDTVPAGAADLDSARTIFERATSAPQRSAADLVDLWIAFADMELRHQNFDRTREVLKRATRTPSKKRAHPQAGASESMLERVARDQRLWNYYVDFEESLGTLESCKAVYDRILDLKIATPQTIINYGTFLEEHNFFEDSFRAYERGVSAFRFPAVFEIWNVYLPKFLQRYKGTKLERTRDLFEQALKDCPPSQSRPLFLMYASFEEEYGLARRALMVYERATQHVPVAEKHEVFLLYVAKAAQMQGVVATRDIYARAIEVLPDAAALDMCVRFAELEVQLGEVARARSLFGHGAQFANPKTNKEFWQKWDAFEVKHGDVETYRQLLRVKRTMAIKFGA